MTNAPLVLRQPAMPPPADVHQLWAKLYGLVNVSKPRRAEAIVEGACEDQVDRLMERLDLMYKMANLHRGPPAYRREVYTMKTQQEAINADWYNQQREQPRDFEEDAVDAYALGATLPPWVELEAIRLGAKVK